MKLISIVGNIGVPKYKQIISSVEKAIDSGKLLRDEKLPSVNKVCLEFSLSRDTVLLAYDELKKRGILYAIPGKGYYVKSVQTTIRQKIFVLFDELNIFKEDLYNAFLKGIGTNAQAEIYFHHFNQSVFDKLIHDSNGNYTKYIIMPTMLSGAAKAIKTLPVNEVYILDQTNPDLKQYPAVYQNFVKDIYDALVQGRSRLSKYKTLVLIFPGFREPLGMKSGFLQFCADFVFEHEVIAEFGTRQIKSDDVYIIPNDRDLVSVIEQSARQELQLGTDFGIISYNETPLKKVVANGITTISTNFETMGKTMAQMINGKKEQIENDCSLIIRNSL